MTAKSRVPQPFKSSAAWNRNGKIMRQMLLPLSIIQPHTQYFEFMEHLAKPCGLLPEEFTLFKTKICDFSTLFIRAQS